MKFLGLTGHYGRYGKYKEECDIWIKLFGHAICIKNYPPFSIRNKLKRYLKIGKWYITFDY